MLETNKYFPHLFNPIKVGTKTIKNRIEAAPALFAFMHFQECPEMKFKPETPRRAFKMLEAKARGGAGSVVLGELSPNHTYCKRFPWEPEIDYKSFEGEIFEITKKTAEMIKSYGALPIGELLGAGEIKTYIGDGINPKGPTSKVLYDGTQLDAFTVEEIKEHIQEHVQACKWFREAGWEGIIIHCGHGWLPAQFLSPMYNKRTDQYGGSFENRARFSVELLQAIRKEMGEDFLLEIRVSASEHLPGGLEIEDAIEFCKLVEPYIDLIHVSCGHYLSSSRSKEFTTAYDPHGVNIEDAYKIKQNVSVPVAVVGGINSPEQAEEAIASGKIDMISLGRQFFADPEFPNKAMDGRADEIRRCLRCGRCYPGPTGEHETERKTEMKFPPLDSCTINPYSVWPASHHKILPDDMPEPKASRKVLVVGGGCGGMQAAITACDRGHNVILCEKSDVLGGLLNFTDHTDHKIDIRNFKNLLIREVEKRPIDLKLNFEVTAENIKEMDVEAVILATGSQDLILPIEGIENTLLAVDVYGNDYQDLGDSTIVLGGGLVGCEAAADYVDQGIKVTIIEKQECLMPDVFGLYRTAVHDFLDRKGVAYKVNAKAIKIGKDYVVIDHEGKEITLTANSVVNAMGRKICNNENLRKAITVPTWEIGDCVAAKQIGDAVSAGWTAAMEIL